MDKFPTLTRALEQAAADLVPAAPQDTPTPARPDRKKRMTDKEFASRLISAILAHTGLLATPEAEGGRA